MGLEKQRRRGDSYRFRLRVRNQEAALGAEEEIKMFKTGEPSLAFYPPHEESEEVVIFLSEASKASNRRRVERGTIATKKDVKNRVIEQYERFIEYENYFMGHPANLPRAWVIYGIKHWDEIQKLKVDPSFLSTAESSLPLREIS